MKAHILRAIAGLALLAGTTAALPAAAKKPHPSASLSVTVALGHMYSTPSGNGKVTLYGSATVTAGSHLGIINCSGSVVLSPVLGKAALSRQTTRANTVSWNFTVTYGARGPMSAHVSGVVHVTCISGTAQGTGSASF